MKSSAFTKALPGIILGLCIFALAFWFSSAWRAGNVGERVPGVVPGMVGQQGGSGTPSAAPTGATVSAAPAGFEPAALPGSWPCFRGASLDNISTESTQLLTSWAAGEPKILWGMNVGEGHAGVAIANSRVYLLDYDRDAKADVLKCMALANGQELWRYSYPVDIKRNHGMSRTVPVIAGDYVVSLGPKCHVVCAEAKTGKVAWSMDLVKQYGTVIPEWYAGQCPIVDNGKVIIAPAGSSLMIAVELATGKVVWQTPNPDRWDMTHSSIVPMTVNGRKMYVYCGSGGVVGVDAQSGSALWKTTEWTVKTANVPTPVVIGDGRVFLCGGYNSGAMMIRVKPQGAGFGVEKLYRLDPGTFGSDQQTPILYKGYIYGVRPNKQLVCMSLDGKIVWDSGAARFGIGPYMIAGGMIYIMNDTGLLTLAQATPSGYKQLAQCQVIADASDSWGPMAMAGGRLIARDLTHMVCLDVAKH